MALEGKDLVAYCGIYCGGCGGYKKGRCKGCKDGGGFKSCPVRICCQERNYETCAECDQLLGCKKLDNFIASLFSFIFRQLPRIEKIKRIKEIGIEAYIKSQGGIHG